MLLVYLNCHIIQLFICHSSLICNIWIIFHNIHISHNMHDILFMLQLFYHHNNTSAMRPNPVRWSWPAIKISPPAALINQRAALVKPDAKDVGRGPTNRSPLSAAVQNSFTSVTAVLTTPLRPPKYTRAKSVTSAQWRGGTDAPSDSDSVPDGRGKSVLSPGLRCGRQRVVSHQSGTPGWTAEGS